MSAAHFFYAFMQTAILEVSTAAAQTWVVQGNFDLAVAGALYATRTAEMLFGADSLEVVHPQLLLAQIYLGTIESMLPKLDS